MAAMPSGRPGGTPGPTVTVRMRGAHTPTVGVRPKTAPDRAGEGVGPGELVVGARTDAAGRAHLVRGAAGTDRRGGRGVPGPAPHAVDVAGADRRRDPALLRLHLGPPGRTRPAPGHRVRHLAVRLVGL